MSTLSSIASKGTSRREHGSGWLPLITEITTSCQPPTDHLRPTAIDIRAHSYLHFMFKGEASMRRILIPLVLVVLAVSIPIAADQLPYQKPSKEVLDILNAPTLPTLSVNPTHTYATLSQAARFPSIAEVSEPMLRIAGIRIDPRTNGLHLAAHSISIEIVKLPEGTKVKLALPPGAQAGPLRWSPDGKMFAFSNTVAHGIELWIGDPSGKARKIEGVKLNAVLGDP